MRSESKFANILAYRSRASPRSSMPRSSRKYPDGESSASLTSTKARFGEPSAAPPAPRPATSTCSVPTRSRCAMTIPKSAASRLPETDLLNLLLTRQQVLRPRDQSLLADLLELLTPTSRFFPLNLPGCCPPVRWAASRWATSRCGSLKLMETRRPWHDYVPVRRPHQEERRPGLAGPAWPPECGRGL